MNRYPINNIYTCVQGEGAQTGVAMVLLRLHGCAVGCPWCDTKETWVFGWENERNAIEDVLGANGLYAWAESESIAEYIESNHPGPKWVLITGGEPSQYQLGALVEALKQKGYKTALETSGTEVGHMTAPIDWVCISPKIDMPGGKEFQPKVLIQAHEIKQVIGRQRDIDRLDQLLAEHEVNPEIVISLQPVSLSDKATQLCIETVQARGWRLSLQTHKLVGLP